MKKMRIVGGVILVILLEIYVVGSIYIDQSYVYENKGTVIEDNSLDNLSMMLESSYGTGSYTETKNNTWPTNGYIFNSTLSKCENGSTISYSNGKVYVTGSVSEKCYVYFDKEPVTLIRALEDDHTYYDYDDFASVSNNDALHIYDTADSYSKIFLNNEDEETRNFICLDENCDLGLFQILGITEDDLIKVISYEPLDSTLLGTDGAYAGSDSLYYWNSANTIENTWTTSKLNTVNLNTNLINKIKQNYSSLYDAIADYSNWPVKSYQSFACNHTAINSYNFINITTIFSILERENGNVLTSYTAKIGLPTITDYFLSVYPSELNDYFNSELRNTDDFHSYMQEDEIWLITTQNPNLYAYMLGNTHNDTAFSGSPHYGPMYTSIMNKAEVKPVLYLKSTVNYASGSGTQDDPFKILF